MLHPSCILCSIHRSLLHKPAVAFCCCHNNFWWGGPFRKNLADDWIYLLSVMFNTGQSYFITAGNSARLPIVVSGITWHVSLWCSAKLLPNASIVPSIDPFFTSLQELPAVVTATPWPWLLPLSNQGKLIGLVILWPSKKHIGWSFPRWICKNWDLKSPQIELLCKISDGLLDRGCMLK